MNKFQNIADVAKSYLGQREISPNKIFKDPVFTRKMESVGFYSGAPWCLFFARLVWKEAGQYINKISASSYTTTKNNDVKDDSRNWHTTPIVGAIAIFWTYKNNKYQGNGHGCVVVDVVDSENYSTVDGNTTDKGGREGVMVAIRHRHLNKESWTKDGLRLMGFVYPK